MQLDILKSGQENFLLLANTANSQTLTASQMTIGAPQVFDDPEDTNLRNTQVTISALPGSTEFKGAQTLRYTRLDVAALVGASYEFQTTAESTIADVLAGVAAAKGLIAADLEITETEMPTWDDGTVDGETAPLTLKAKAGSYAYIGTVTINVIEPVDGRERFADLYAVQDLDGFEAQA
ncbi:hypothetical protein D3C73_173670 [compost metagenome]|jgi:hypothetical protein